MYRDRVEAPRMVLEEENVELREWWPWEPANPCVEHASNSEDEQEHVVGWVLDAAPLILSWAGQGRSRAQGSLRARVPSCSTGVGRVWRRDAEARRG